MKVLVIGGGGREHALAWKAAQHSDDTQVFVAPGNAGTAREPRINNVAIADSDIDGLLEFARREAIDLTIVGPEAPLVAGLCDKFAAAGLACFGPSAKAAQLEGSKAFSKDFLARHQIPTAAYSSFTEVEPAIAYLQTQQMPIVIKADGLAAGKGVVIAQDLEQAERTVRDMLDDSAFGEAGSRIVIEEFLKGEEVSFICMVGNGQILPLATSQDHKARDEGDTGPNTGGMGAYSPAPLVDGALHQRIMDEVIRPTVDGMNADGIPYTGFLYAGLMIAADGTPKVLEFNCRFGDPETQPIMMRLQSDLVSLCQAALKGELNQHSAEWREQVCLGVVLASGGYPGSYRKGVPISLNEAETGADSKVFFAGVAEQADQLLTSGGRVLCACALGDSVSEAQRKAYAVADQIDFEGRFLRRDIGHHAIAREG